MDKKKKKKKKKKKIIHLIKVVTSQNASMFESILHWVKDCSVMKREITLFVKMNDIFWEVGGGNT